MQYLFLMCQVPCSNCALQRRQCSQPEISSADDGPIPGRWDLPAPAPPGLIDDGLRETIKALQEPEESAADRSDNSAAKRRAELESDAATPADVIRREDRAAKGIAFAKGLPVKKDGTYVCGEHGSMHKTLDWDRDPHRLIICNMKGPIEDAADRRFGDGGAAPEEQRTMFHRLVTEEVEKAKKAKEYKTFKEASRPYKARVALGLIALLASVLG